MPIDHPAALAIITAAFLIAGFTKGVIGLGQQAVALAFLVATIGLTQAMGLLFLTSTMALAVIPTLAGAYMGQMVRRRLSEETFRRVF